MNKIVLIAVSLLSFQGLLFAQTSPVLGNQVNIGPTGSTANKFNTASDTIYNGAFGTSNALWASRSLAIGYNNILGVNPSIGYWSQWLGNATLAVGSGNNLNANYSAAIGCGNHVDQGESSLLVGNSNAMSFDPDAGSGNESLLVGDGNVNYAAYYSIMAGQSNGASGWANATLGAGLINNWNYATVVGVFNAYNGGDGLLFVVGNGTSSTVRKNAVEVYNDGTMVISKRQGDIVMGVYGNGNGD